MSDYSQIINIQSKLLNLCLVLNPNISCHYDYNHCVFIVRHFICLIIFLICLALAFNKYIDYFLLTQLFSNNCNKYYLMTKVPSTICKGAFHLMFSSATAQPTGRP